MTNIVNRSTERTPPELSFAKLLEMEREVNDLLGKPTSQDQEILYKMMGD